MIYIWILPLRWYDSLVSCNTHLDFKLNLDISTPENKKQEYEYGLVELHLFIREQFAKKENNYIFGFH